jgi:hypothetical protein
LTPDFGGRPLQSYFQSGGIARRPTRDRVESGTDQPVQPVVVPFHLNSSAAMGRVNDSIPTILLSIRNPYEFKTLSSQISYHL